MAPQSPNLWFVAPGDCKTAVGLKSLDWRGEDISLDLSQGERAELPSSTPPKGKTRLWLARSTEARMQPGQVGLDAGHGMAVAPDSTLALAGDAPLRLWNASGDAPLRLTLRAIDIDLAPMEQGGALYRATLPPLTARPVSFATGDAPLSLELPAEVAAFATPDEAPDSRFLAATRHCP